MKQRCAIKEINSRSEELAVSYITHKISSLFVIYMKYTEEALLDVHELYSQGTSRNSRVARNFSTIEICFA